MKNKSNEFERSRFASLLRVQHITRISASFRAECGFATGREIETRISFKNTIVVRVFSFQLSNGGLEIHIETSNNAIKRLKLPFRKSKLVGDEWKNSHKLRTQLDVGPGFVRKTLFCIINEFKKTWDVDFDRVLSVRATGVAGNNNFEDPKPVIIKLPKKN